jgi:anthranilate phosphoribosyltransferase
LTNPAGATHQLIGVYDPALTETMARVLGALGSKAAFVVHGADGLDELTTTGLNRVSRLEKDGQVSTYDFNPVELGLNRATLTDFAGGTPEENAQITHDILSGKDKGPRRDIVLLNAAAALSIDGDDFPTGLAQARESIDSGAALGVLNAWIGKTNSFA